jgi:ribonuclease Z
VPTVTKRPTSQLVNFSNKYYLIDCGEGTQIQLKKAKVSFLKINNIFISHLHGDHYFGLVGLVSSMHLLGRVTDLHIYCPKDLKEIIDVQLRASGTILRYTIVYHFLETKETELIYEGKDIEVQTIPLKHKILTNGFLFKEKPRVQKIKAEKISFYQIPHFELNKIKQGGDYTTAEGEVIKNELLAYPAVKSRSYAFCSDTAYREKIIPIIADADLLYHETTFLESEKDLAKKTFHSTITDACRIAKQANVGGLLIGHFSARYNDTDYPTFLAHGKEVFENIQIAKEGKSFII